MKSKRKFLSIFAILFALVFALSVCFFAACGKKDNDEKDNDTTTEQDDGTSGDDKEEPEPEPEPEPTPEPEPEATTVSSATELTEALSVGGAIELGADIVGMFTVSADTTVTLDLAGYSITDKAVATTADTEETQYTITVAENTSLTITDSSADKGGSIVCTYAATDNQNSRLGAAVYTCGALDIIGGTIESSSVGILAEGGTTTITGGTISTEYYTIFEAHGTAVVNVGGDAVVTGTRGIYVGGDAYYGYGSSSDSNSWDDDADCTLNVYGDAQISTTFGSAISTLGYTGMNTAKINISGGTISGRPVEYEDNNTTEKVTVMPAVYLPNGILNISGGTIEGTTAVEVRGGAATITGGTIKTTTKTTNTPAWNGSGATSYGYAVAVYSYNTVTRPDTNQAIENDLNVTVSGGTFEGPLCGTWKEGASVPEYTFSITGGTFTEDPSEYLAGGYKAEKNETKGYYEIVDTWIRYDFSNLSDDLKAIFDAGNNKTVTEISFDTDGILKLNDGGKKTKFASDGTFNTGGGTTSSSNVVQNYFTIDLSKVEGATGVIVEFAASTSSTWNDPVVDEETGEETEGYYSPRTMALSTSLAKWSDTEGTGTAATALASESSNGTSFGTSVVSYALQDTDTDLSTMYILYSGSMYIYNITIMVG